MQDEFSIAEAKNKLPSIVHYVEDGSNVKLTRRGKPVAVLLSIKEYERLSIKPAKFWDALSGFREKMNLMEADISDGDFNDLRDSVEGRKVVL